MGENQYLLVRLHIFFTIPNKNIQPLPELALDIENRLIPDISV
jgi:hypothetical protein